MITVMGATGRVGRQIVAELVAAGEQVRAISRSAPRASGPGAAGPDVQPWAGDAADAGFLTGAFRGADAVFTMLPVDAHEPDQQAAQDAKGSATAAAVRESGVPYVVMLSSLGAELASGTGFIEALHRQERRLAATGVAQLVLRPAWFLENAAEALPTVAALGCVADSLAADLPVPMVATRDVAAAAAGALRTRDRVGILELLGPRDLTQTEVAALLGEHLGRPGLPYVRLPDAEMVDALVGVGFSPDAASRHVGMTRALNAGRIAGHRSAGNTTPTRFEDVVGEWVA